MKRIKQSAKNLHTEEGATLVELLAAIAILSIIVTAFLAFFVQAGSTNNRTDKVNEATFIAQEEMENVMFWHQTDWPEGTPLDNFEQKYTSKNGFEIKTEIAVSEINDTEIEMYQVIVTVDERGGNGYAQMETWLPLEEEVAAPAESEE